MRRLAASKLSHEIHCESAVAFANGQMRSRHLVAVTVVQQVSSSDFRMRVHCSFAHDECHNREAIDQAMLNTVKRGTASGISTTLKDVGWSMGGKNRHRRSERSAHQRTRWMVCWAYLRSQAESSLYCGDFYPARRYGWRKRRRNLSCGGPSLSRRRDQ